MKKVLRKIVLFSLILGGALLLSKCSNENYQPEMVHTSTNVKSIKNYGESKEIYYEGFLVNHRFKSTEEDLTKEHTLEYLKELYNRLRKNKKKGASSKSSNTELELPGPNAILEASKVVLGDFPYEKIENFNLVGLQEQNSLDVNMVTFDFDNFTEEDIQPNNVILDEYYSQNLDYSVLAEIANNPGVYDNLDGNLLAKSNSEAWTYFCTMAQVVVNGYGFVRGSISYALAGDRARTSSTNYYQGFSSSNSRRDAYRHILWNSLLAQYYFTVSSKSPRIGFANVVATSRESSLCGSSNAIDSREMDYHNNFIGRKIWNDNTTYRTFWGWNVGLRKPSTSRLKDLAYAKVEKQSCFVVKDHPIGDDFDFTIEETKAEILKIYENTAVYIVGPIANRRYSTQTTYDYSNCDNNNNDEIFDDFDDFGANNSEILEFNNKDIAIDDYDGNDCPIIITNTIVTNACFISKDSNYNPY